MLEFKVHLFEQDEQGIIIIIIIIIIIVMIILTKSCEV